MNEITMFLLMSFILLSGLLIYMIFLSNEMSKICDRLLGRTPEFINPKLKEKFDNFKIFNKQYIMFLYQIVNI